MKKNYMSNKEFNEYLEKIAQLIEANSSDSKSAAQIVRDAKTNKKTDE